MGKSNSPPKYALVLWKDNTWSVLETKLIPNPLMLYNENLVDDIPYVTQGVKPEDAELHPGRVLRLHAKKRSLLEEANSIADKFIDEEEKRGEKSARSIENTAGKKGPKPSTSHQVTPRTNDDDERSGAASADLRGKEDKSKKQQKATSPSLSDIEDFGNYNGSSSKTPESPDDEEPPEGDSDKQYTVKRPRSESAEIALNQESTHRLQQKITKLEGLLVEQKLKNEELKKALPEMIKKAVVEALHECRPTFMNEAGATPKTSRSKDSCRASASNLITEEEVHAVTKKMEKWATKIDIVQALQGNSASIVIGNLTATLFTMNEMRTSTVSGLKTEKPNILDKERMTLLREFALAKYGLREAECNVHVGNKLRNVCSTRSKEEGTGAKGTKGKANKKNEESDSGAQTSSDEDK